jgi:TonB family protein
MLRKECFLARSTRNVSHSLAWATLLLALLLTSAFVPASRAQKVSLSDRRVLVSVKPDYPEILKRAQVGGLVRLKATVLPSGTVNKVDVLGGNPILAENAVTAVMKWKFAPAASQTVEEISLSFSPH